MKVTYLTGCDSKYFLMTGILLQAFKKHCPDRDIQVCDFGLKTYQKRIFSSLGILLEKPPVLDDNQHPWIYKSSVIKYLHHASLASDIVVWLDSDCFPVGPFAECIEDIAAQWEGKDNMAALCQGKKGKTWHLASPAGNIRYFGMQPDYPYYNSGMWILRSNRVLCDWATEIVHVPKNGMFEQDTFNYLLNKNNTRIKRLDNDKWNVTHDGLMLVESMKNGEFVLNGQKVLIIHITGDYIPREITAGPFKGFIRTLKKSELKHLQIQLLREWVASIHYE